MLVVVGGVGVPPEDAPAPLIDQITKGEERHLVQRHLQQEIDVALCIKHTQLSTYWKDREVLK